MITFLTSGLWHGASWTYVIWGAIHGVAQLIEDHLQIKKESKVRKLISWVAVFVFCNVAWVFFRAESFSDALTVFYRIIIESTNISQFTHTTLGLSKKRFAVILFIILVLAIYDFMSLKYDVIEKISEKKIFLRWIVYLMLIVGTFFIYVTMGVSNASFVYFQF
jgi:hypothetical protein